MTTAQEAGIRSQRWEQNPGTLSCAHHHWYFNGWIKCPSQDILMKRRCVKILTTDLDYKCKHSMLCKDFFEYTVGQLEYRFVTVILLSNTLLFGALVSHTYSNRSSYQVSFTTPSIYLKPFSFFFLLQYLLLCERN